MADKKTIFVKEGSGKKGLIDIIEGYDKGGQVLSIKRFICQVQRQETEKETNQVADLLVNALNHFKNLKQK